MAQSRQYTIEAGTQLPFHNRADYCVGTGRMGLALQREYQEQLQLVQQKIGFRHIRGHGLFCDDMAIYHRFTDESGRVHTEYNFTYLDMVMDSYRRLGLRPFLELGFMPGDMASGTQTVFYWKGNVTPPRSDAAWTELVRTTLRHLMERYGADEVTAWPIEVWNEPNLQTFWKDADMAGYFHLFAITFRAIKELDGRFRVGGPAICGVDDVRWMRSFLEYCRENRLSPDFVTRHHYTIRPPVKEGHYSYAALQDPEEGFAALAQTRAIVDSFSEFRGLPIHVTEFNTSYTPRAPIHDTNLNAAYIARLLSRLGDCNESYSYWTFGDIFEENGVPATPFHGGFGLVANGCIPKPTFWTFQFYKQLQGVCVHRSPDAVIVQKPDGRYCGVAWNPVCRAPGGALELTFRLPAVGVPACCLLTRTVDETAGNPLKVWHDMGEPASLSREQLARLRESAVPRVATRRLAGGTAPIEITLPLAPNAVVCFELFAVAERHDWGYSYSKAEYAGS